LRFATFKQKEMMTYSPFLLALFTSDVAGLVAQTGPVAKIVLIILLFFSLLSWSIILAKWSKFRRMRAQSGRFLRAFKKAGARLQDVSAVSEQFKPSPLVAVFEAGFDEYRRQGGARSTTAVQRACQIAASEEMTQMESRLPWLATTGAVTPFVGLFGTVWGIIDAFQGLGNAGAATLRAVAPGISEALITTAAGLFTAIPAVIAYNQYMQQLREFGARMDDFTLEMLNTVERPVAQPARTRESVVLEER
jgi:biopolymer transport protein TolQ